MAIFPSAITPYMLPKFTLITLTAVALTALAAFRWLSAGQLRVPQGPVSYTAVAFLFVFVVATASSSSPWASSIGAYERHNGLIAYWSYITVFFTALAVVDSSTARRVARAAVIALAIVVAYGLLQVVGVELIDWSHVDVTSPYSLFGNTNFAGAWPGAAASMAVLIAASADEAKGWRVTSWVVLTLTLVYVILTGTSQGPIVFLVAVGFAAVVIATDRGSATRTLVSRYKATAALIAIAAVLTCAAAIVRTMPYLRAQLDQALVERPEFWIAAWRIFLDHPWIGTGPATFGHFFLQYRPISHAVAYGDQGADVPHSVPLAMLANGGVLLAASYIAAVLAVGVVLMLGLRGSQGNQRLLLAGFGGTWLGYQAQSMVSIDVPPLAFWHWLSAGVIVALVGAPKWKQVDIPGVVRHQRGKTSARPAVSRRASIGKHATAAIALVAAWLALYPLRADVLAGSALVQAKNGGLVVAVPQWERAMDLNPSEARYPALLAEGYEVLGRYEEGFEAATEAARRDPGSMEYALLAAEQARQMGNEVLAAEWYREAARRDPKRPEVLTHVAAYFIDSGGFETARRYVRAALNVEPSNETAQQQLMTLNESRSAQ